MRTTDAELVAEERRKYTKMWGVPEYHRHSPGLAVAPHVAGLLGMQPGESVIDYGCGAGLALDVFRASGLTAIGVDLVALGPDVIEATLWNLPADLGPTDYAFSADVMEHIPTRKVDVVLGGIRDRTLRAAAFTIASTKCTVGQRHGERLHLTVKPRHWWLARLHEHFADVEVHDGDRPWRALFVCRP